MSWERILFYIFVLIALFIYVKISNIQINGKKIKLVYRLSLALFFPIILLIGILIGSVIIGIILLVLFIIGIWILFSRLKNKSKNKLFSRKKGKFKY
ncbi:MAG: hypothetical protein KJ623_00795 [Nanoarchaeota archaeon]|nr:hypothetical protein [Nanoarchaeota archaeon]MBU0963048.1 hypothetical protein [Nanoarchaeota archaeon]